MSALRWTLLLLLLLGSGAACRLQQGRSLDLRAETLLERSRDMEARHDFIAAHHLLVRARSKAKGSYHGVVATLRYHARDEGRLHGLIGGLAWPSIDPSCEP
ncbi:MAG: hypothetical protein RBU37_23240 [Myxococcota bacterium]|jgi:hypothetical protein|nr:hypothetical protein [Myxococcota bacterium]